MTQTPPPAGWYPQGNQERWWDGNAWSDNFRPLGSQPVQQPGYPQAQPTYGQPQQPYMAAQPVKQSHTGRNILIVFGVLILLFVGGCFAVVAIVSDQVNEAVNDDSPGGPNNPLTIQAGQAFEVSGFEYADGWTVGADAGGYLLVSNLKLTNKRGKADRLYAEIDLLNGNEVLATATCNNFDKIAEDTTITLECTSTDLLPTTYDKITIHDAF